MTARFKDFGTGTGLNSDEPIIFRLHGEEFKCRPQLQGKAMLNMAVDASSDDPAAAAKLISDFFSNVLVDESFTRFEALTKDPDRIVTVETLGEIVGWLMGEYAGRPEQQPEAS